MKQAGVFRMLVARRFGGDEATPSDFYRLVERIASADGSSGWVASFGHAAIYLSALPVATLEKIYASGPDVIMQIVTSFVIQLNGTIEVRHHNPGTEFLVILPR